MKSIIKPYSNKGFVDSAGSFATLIFCQLKKREEKGEREIPASQDLQAGNEAMVGEKMTIELIPEKDLE